MGVKTFGATMDAALALHSLHVCLTRVAVLTPTSARPPPADVAVFSAGCPSVRVLDLVVCAQEHLLVILLIHDACGTGPAPNSFA